jgi:hypothetical protein
MSQDSHLSQIDYLLWFACVVLQIKVGGGGSIPLCIMNILIFITVKTQLLCSSAVFVYLCIL